MYQPCLELFVLKLNPGAIVVAEAQVWLEAASLGCEPQLPFAGWPDNDWLTSAFAAYGQQLRPGAAKVDITASGRLPGYHGQV